MKRVSLEYSGEEALIAKTSRELAQDFGPEYWSEKDQDHEFPREFWSALADVGFLGIHLFEEYKGGGMRISEMRVAVEELGANGCGLGACWLLMVTSTVCATIIRDRGTDEQKERYFHNLRI